MQGAPLGTSIQGWQPRRIRVWVVCYFYMCFCGWVKCQRLEQTCGFVAFIQMDVFCCDAMGCFDSIMFLLRCLCFFIFWDASNIDHSVKWEEWLKKIKFNWGCRLSLVRKLSSLRTHILQTNYINTFKDGLVLISRSFWILWSIFSPILIVIKRIVCVGHLLWLWNVLLQN